MKTNKNTSIQLLARCLSSIIREGYTENFIMTEKGLRSEASGRCYGDNETKVVSRLVFENNNKPQASAIYVIETNDGKKGTWIHQVPISNSKN